MDARERTLIRLQVVADTKAGTRLVLTLLQTSNEKRLHISGKLPKNNLDTLHSTVLTTGHLGIVVCVAIVAFFVQTELVFHRSTFT